MFSSGGGFVCCGGGDSSPGSFSGGTFVPRTAGGFSRTGGGSSRTGGGFPRFGDEFCEIWLSWFRAVHCWGSPRESCCAAPGPCWSGLLCEVVLLAVGFAQLGPGSCFYTGARASPL